MNKLQYVLKESLEKTREITEEDIIKVMLKTKREYDALADYEKVGMPKGQDGPRLYAQAILKEMNR